MFRAKSGQNRCLGHWYEKSERESQCKTATTVTVTVTN